VYFDNDPNRVEILG